MDAFLNFEIKTMKSKNKLEMVLFFYHFGVFFLLGGWQSEKNEHAHKHTVFPQIIAVP